MKKTIYTISSSSPLLSLVSTSEISHYISFKQILQ